MTNQVQIAEASECLYSKLSRFFDQEGLLNTIQSVNLLDCGDTSQCSLQDLTSPIQHAIEKLYFGCPSQTGTATIEPIEGLSVYSLLEHFETRGNNPSPFGAHDGFYTFCTGQYHFYLVDDLTSIALIKFRVTLGDDSGIVLSMRACDQYQFASEEASIEKI